MDTGCYIYDSLKTKLFLRKSEKKRFVFPFFETFHNKIRFTIKYKPKIIIKTIKTLQLLLFNNLVQC